MLRLPGLLVLPWCNSIYIQSYTGRVHLGPQLLSKLTVILFNLYSLICRSGLMMDPRLLNQALFKEKSYKTIVRKVLTWAIPDRRKLRWERCALRLLLSPTLASLAMSCRIYQRQLQGRSWNHLFLHSEWMSGVESKPCPIVYQYLLDVLPQISRATKALPRAVHADKWSLQGHIQRCSPPSHLISAISPRSSVVGGCKLIRLEICRYWVSSPWSLNSWCNALFVPTTLTFGSEARSPQQALPKLGISASIGCQCRQTSIASLDVTLLEFMSIFGKQRKLCSNC